MNAFDNPPLNPPRSLRGYFLLARKHLVDSNFYRSAVLMLEHNQEGAMGVIVNRPSTVDVANALAGHFDVPNDESVIYDGGPVEPMALSMLHDNPSWGEADLSIVPGVYAGGSAEAFEQIITQSNTKSSVNFRVFSGYSGWGKHQLESEIERGDWFTLKARSQYIFHDRPYDVWDELMSEFQKQHRMLPISAEKAEWN